VLFRDLHAGVTEQDRNLVDGNTGQQHLHRERVAEHVAMASLRCTVRPAEISHGEEAAIGPLPVRYIGLGIAVSAPEEIRRIRLESIGNIAEQFHDMRR